MNFIFLMVFIIISIISGTSYLIFSYESPSSTPTTSSSIPTPTPTPSPTTTTTMAPIRYETFKGNCATASGGVPDFYNLSNLTIDFCKSTCDNNEYCQGYSYMPESVVPDDYNNVSLCNIYSNTNVNMGLPYFNYIKGSDPGSPITKGNTEEYTTCYHKLLKNSFNNI